MTSRGRPATRRVGPFVRMPERMAEVGIDPEPVLRGLSFGSKARVDCDGWPPFQAGLLAPGRAAGLAESGLSWPARRPPLPGGRTSPRWRRGSISPPARSLAISPTEGASFRAELDAIRSAVARELSSLWVPFSANDRSPPFLPAARAVGGPLLARRRRALGETSAKPSGVVALGPFILLKAKVSRKAYRDIP